MIVRSSDGTFLFCQSFFVEKPVGALLVVHGLGEHSGRYEELVSHAHKLRLNVHLFDLRGHGRSQGIRGHFLDINEHHLDMDSWLEALVSAGELDANKPCFLLGHSLGGLIALTFVPRYIKKPLYPEISGLILSSPAIGVKWNPLRLLESRLAKQLPSFLQSVHVPNGIPATHLTHDKEEMEKYDSDPLVHKWITPGAFLAMERAFASLPKILRNLSLPTLFLLSGKDKVVDTSASESFVNKLRIAHPGKVEVKVFHSFFHEPFHELKRDRAFLELKKWIVKCLAPTKTTRSSKNSSRSSGRGAIEKETSR